MPTILKRKEKDERLLPEIPTSRPGPRQEEMQRGERGGKKGAYPEPSRVREIPITGEEEGLVRDLRVRNSPPRVS